MVRRSGHTLFPETPNTQPYPSCILPNSPSGDIANRGLMHVILFGKLAARRARRLRGADFTHDLGSKLTAFSRAAFCLLLRWGAIRLGLCLLLCLFICRRCYRSRCLLCRLPFTFCL